MQRIVSNPLPRPTITISNSYHKQHNRSTSNPQRHHQNESQNQNYRSDVIQIGEFCIDKTAKSHGPRTPHYKVSNQIPIEFQKGDGGKPISLRNCFNCGGGHMIRDCKHPRDANCVRFNRHLKDSFDAQKNGSNKKQKRAWFSNQRYYEQNKASSHSNSNSHSHSVSKSKSQSCKLPPATGSFDDNLKQIQIENQQQNDKQDVDADNASSDSESESEHKIGFKFDSEIECLNVFRTEKEIKEFETQYANELADEQKQRENDANAKRSKYDLSFKSNKMQHIAHPNDIDRRKDHNRNRHSNSNRDRDYRTNSNSKSYNLRSRHRDQGRYRDQDRERDRDRSRERRPRKRRRNLHLRSRSDEYDTNRYDENERIDYGLKQKAKKINKFIDNKYDRNKRRKN